MPSRDYLCYKWGKEGHYVRGCTSKVQSDDWQNKSQGSQLRYLQMVAIGPKEERNKKNIP